MSRDPPNISHYHICVGITELEGKIKLSDAEQQAMGWLGLTGKESAFGANEQKSLFYFT